MLLRRLASILARIVWFGTAVTFVIVALFLNANDGFVVTILGKSYEVGQINLAMALLAGLALGWPLGEALGHLLRQRRWRRWLIMTAIFLWVIITTTLLGRQAFIAAVPAILLTVFFTITLLREFYGGDLMAAFRHHLQLATGGLRGFEIVDDGRTVFPANAGLLLGPRLLVIRSGNTAVTVDAGRQRAYGPGINTTNEFEFVKAIYKLGEHQKDFRVKSVLTEEGIPLTVRISATYKIDVPDERAYGNEPFDDRNRQAILRLHREFDDWRSATHAIIEQALRDTIKQRSIVAFGAQQEGRNPERDLLHRLAFNVQHLANRRLEVRQWPIRVHQVTVIDVQPSESALETISRTWAQGQEADAWRIALGVMARGYEEARTLGMTGSELRSEVLRYTLEQAARDPTTAMMFNRELNELLAALRK